MLLEDVQKLQSKYSKLVVSEEESEIELQV